MATTTTIKAAAFKDGWSASTVRSGTYTANYGTLAAPTPAPAAGTYDGPTTVTLTAAAGATIRYTTNGAEPNTNSPLYTAPVTLAANTTVKAKAYHPDYTTSATATQVYTIRVLAPEFSLTSGAYSPGDSVTISSPDPAATVRITLTGVDPIVGDPIAPTGMSIFVGGYTLKARASKAGCADSVIAMATYSLTAPVGIGALAAGASHTLAATPEGLLYGWGLGTSGQLGTGATTSKSTPTLVQTLTGVVMVAAGTSHSLALTVDGHVLAWGLNSSGQLGDGTTTMRSSPVPVAGLTNIVAIAAGGSHSLALASDGQVFGWGAGNSGQLGQGTTIGSNLPLPVPSLTGVTSIAAGGSHSLAVTDAGSLFAWGANSSFQLGDGTTTMRKSPQLVPGLTDVAGVTAGTSYTLARLQNGTAYAWGQGTAGQLGLGTTTNKTTPTPIPGMSVIDLVAGGAHAIALRTDGVLVAWGTNSAGQVGDGTTAIRTSPTPVGGPSTTAFLAGGGSHTAAMTPAGHLWTWGAGGSGQLGDGTTANHSTPMDVFAFSGMWGATPPPFLSLSSGTYHDPQTVLVTTPTEGSVIHYSTSGTPPTEADPILASGTVLPIDSTTTLMVRAWAPGLPPSHVVTGTYTLQPLAPTIAPSGGPFSTPQTVTIATSTEGCTLRYTIDGTEPTESSPSYAGPFSAQSSMTVKARAFKPNWLVSDAAAADVTFNYGQLATPVPTPPAGSYEAGELVSLGGPVGATIRYTSDGSAPTAASPEYVQPIRLASSTTIRAKAFSADWQPSAVLVASYTITDTVSPTIVASVSPAPGISGWWTGQVTVSFSCDDTGSGIASCQPPFTTYQEGSNVIVGGVARDNAGNTAETSIALTIDTHAPTITIGSPRPGSLVPAGTLTIRGAASDGVSQVSEISCNGVPGTVVGGGYQCDITVLEGTNHVVVTGTDVAGHSAQVEADFNVGTSATLWPQPQSLGVTPVAATLLLGTTRAFNALDDLKRNASDAAWSVSDTAVIQLDPDSGTVTAVGVGTATLTAAWQGLQATATVSVVAGTNFPDGTVLWSSPGLASTTYARIIEAVPGGDNTPDLYAIERGATGVRALRFDGRELWGLQTDRTIWGAAADNNGGLVLGLCSEDSVCSITHVSGLSGGIDWEYTAPTLAALSDPAVHPTGTIFVTQGATLIGFDVNTGAIVQNVSLRDSWPTCPSQPTATDYCGGVAGAPAISEDGSVYALTTYLHRYAHTEHQSIVWENDGYKVQLIRLRPDGSTTSQRLGSYMSGYCTTPSPGHSLPNGVGGGVWTTWSNIGSCGNSTNISQVKGDDSQGGGVIVGGVLDDMLLLPGDVFVGRTKYGSLQEHRRLVFAGPEGDSSTIDLPDGSSDRLVAASDGRDLLMDTAAGPRFLFGAADLSSVSLRNPKPLVDGFVGTTGQLITNVAGPAFVESGSTAPYTGGNRHFQWAPATSADPEKLAVKMLQKYYPMSFSREQEFCGRICRTERGAVFPRYPNNIWGRGSINTCSTQLCPQGDHTIAHWHTHPGVYEDPEHNIIRLYPESLSFSQGVDIQTYTDLKASDPEFLAGYLGNYCGQVRKFDPANPTVEIGLRDVHLSVPRAVSERPECAP